MKKSYILFLAYRITWKQFLVIIVLALASLLIPNHIARWICFGICSVLMAFMYICNMSWVLETFPPLLLDIERLVNRSKITLTAINVWEELHEMTYLRSLMFVADFEKLLEYLALGGIIKHGIILCHKTHKPIKVYGEVEASEYAALM
jgi:hypothetical protein